MRGGKKIFCLLPLMDCKSTDALEGGREGEMEGGKGLCFNGYGDGKKFAAIGDILELEKRKISAEIIRIGYRFNLRATTRHKIPKKTASLYTSEDVPKTFRNLFCLTSNSFVVLQGL
jgi:hypothetical protein